MISIVVLLGGCQKFIDVVPDNVATIENAFSLRNEAEKYLFTCYSYLPKNANPLLNTGFLAGDEVWLPVAQREILGSNWHIARGAQSINNVLVNNWDGANDRTKISDEPLSYFRAIRDCNIFIENVSDLSKVPDLNADERSRWLGEVKFLKAYYHFLLMRAYGPIPIIRDNLPLDATAEQVRVEQRPVDEVVDYLVQLLDEAVATSVPLVIQDRALQLGRITKPIILAVKANILLTAASPLFNGNSDFSTFKNVKGESLFSPTEDQAKWQRAADAAAAAIESAESAGFILTKFNKAQFGQFKLSDSTVTVLSIGNGFNKRWQDEHIWANSNSQAWNIQRDAMPLLTPEAVVGTARQHLSVPIKIAEMFYSSHGVPISEDKTLDFTNRYTVRTATNNERFYIKEGYQTARLNFDREPRFYASLAFDGSVWFKFDTKSFTDEDTYVVEAKLNQRAGANNHGWINETGYFVRKLVNWEQSFTTSGISYQSYPWPDIRVSDMYLAYAEAENEANGPSANVYKYLDLVRERAGLGGVVESWANYSSNPAKPTTKEGLRDIIRQERTIELAFEGKRFWDLRRWKTAVNSLNQNITGWSVSQERTSDYYRLRTLFPQTFIAPRDYFWPLSERTLLVNPNLVQNVGW
ncbi:RagB/SusD family nutrient uptake outer membrane protein [Sphingobacterium sp. Ka21]|uniref:RagB/SusD family nutrient uptake outer membrane protein n=2 Tax=Sphingobacterium pedocola TaxID=2082722 RepID=A0ABR9TA53_9SPHI|nr:RagB/SusD family nutrient uptake outer membrane protein [Sphingobacterium pedocola]